MQYPITFSFDFCFKPTSAFMFCELGTVNFIYYFIPDRERKFIALSKCFLSI